MSFFCFLKKNCQTSSSLCLWIVKIVRFDYILCNCKLCNIFGLLVRQNMHFEGITFFTILTFYRANQEHNQIYDNFIAALKLQPDCWRNESWQLAKCISWKRHQMKPLNFQCKFWHSLWSCFVFGVSGQTETSRLFKSQSQNLPALRCCIQGA